ncbi:MAG: DUF58 domain-containing protein [Candidatus Methylacidiphilales bacterium]|nr:DUF58 domain-containing protein [Candidatus Methylacidiphilales bacterium]
MIVPRQRLLVLCAVVGVPALGCIGLGGAVLFPGALAFVLALAVALVDMVAGRRLVKGLRVEYPPDTRMPKEKAGEFVFTLTNDSSSAAQLLCAVPFPLEVSTAVEALPLKVPPPGLQLSVTFPCLPRRRGVYLLQGAYIEVFSPLGLWGVRAVLPAAGRLHVYPNLQYDRKKLAAMFLRRGDMGLHTQRQMGKGREFEKLREYFAGDDVGDIHWKATARRGHPVTKVFQIERTQEVYVVMDASRLSARPAGVASRQAEEMLAKVRKRSLEMRGDMEVVEPDVDVNVSPMLDRYMMAGLVLAQVSQRQGDVFGMAVFSDRVHTFLRAKTGPSHYHACRDALSAVEPRLVAPDFGDLATTLRTKLRRRALIIVMTSLEDQAIAEHLETNLGLLTRQHLVLVCMIQPPGVAPMFENQNAESSDDVYRHFAGHLRWEDLREREARLRKAGAHFCMLPNNRFSADIVSEYINIKRRQLI